MIKNQNDFEIPEENITCENMSKNNFFTEEKKIENNKEDIEEEENIVDRYNINNISSNISDNISDIYKTKKKEKEKEKETKKIYKTKKKKNKNKNKEIEMENMTKKDIFSDEDEESDLNADDEGGIQPLNQRKLKDQ